MTYQPSLPEMQAALEAGAVRSRQGVYLRAGKRALDLVLAALLLLPVGMVVALLAVKVSVQGGQVKQRLN